MGGGIFCLLGGDSGPARRKQMLTVIALAETMTHSYRPFFERRTRRE
jgi:hypothetical protein